MISKPGRYWDEVKRRFDNEIIPALGLSTILSNVSKADIRALIDKKEEKTKAGARLTFAALRPFFKWCVSRDIIPSSPCDGVESPGPVASRDRVLAEDEIIKVWKAASAMPYPFGPFYKLLLLTAQRRDEVANMRWSELDLSKRTWIIPKERTKNRKEHLVHLSPWALDIIASHSLNKGKSPFVLTTNMRSGVSGYSKAKRELDTLADVKKPWRGPRPQT